MSLEEQLPDLNMDPTTLYREEVFTDGKVGHIRRLTPVNGDGSDDDSRQVSYSGSTQLLTPMGTLPLNFELPGASLQEAAENFNEEARKAMQQTVEELKEMQREQASSIVTPESGGMGGGMGGGQGGSPFGGGGAPGGGIRMP